MHKLLPLLNNTPLEAHVYLCYCLVHDTHRSHQACHEPPLPPDPTETEEFTNPANDSPLGVDATVRRVASKETNDVKLPQKIKTLLLRSALGSHQTHGLHDVHPASLQLPRPPIDYLVEDIIIRANDPLGLAPVQEILEKHPCI